MNPASPTPHEPNEPRPSRLKDQVPDGWRPRPRHPRLSVWVRLGIFVVGWLLVLLGLVGLVLPGLQGILTLLLGAALLSLVSELAYNRLRWLFQRWPQGWKRVYRFRQRVYRWLDRDNGS